MLGVEHPVQVDNVWGSPCLLEHVELPHDLLDLFLARQPELDLLQTGEQGTRGFSSVLSPGRAPVVPHAAVERRMVVPCKSVRHTFMAATLPRDMLWTLKGEGRGRGRRQASRHSRTINHRALWPCVAVLVTGEVRLAMAMATHFQTSPWAPLPIFLICRKSRSDATNLPPYSAIKVGGDAMRWRWGASAGGQEGERLSCRTSPNRGGGNWHSHLVASAPSRRPEVRQHRAIGDRQASGAQRTPLTSACIGLGPGDIVSPPMVILSPKPMPGDSAAGLWPPCVGNPDSWNAGATSANRGDRNRQNVQIKQYSRMPV